MSGRISSRRASQAQYDHFLEPPSGFAALLRRIGMTQRSAIRRLAEFVSCTPTGEMPLIAVCRAADCVLDVVGAAAAGFNCVGPNAFRRSLAAISNDGTSRIWFGERKSSAIAAATANAAAATALDVDDGHRKAAGHPGASVICAALAAAEENKVDGLELLEAVVLGYQAAVSVALARHPEHHGSTASGRWCGVGAAVSYARLRRSGIDATANAILIAEQHAPRLAAAQHHGFAGSDVKEGVPWAANGGMMAVLLAEQGFRGYPHAFDQNVLYDPDRLIENIDGCTALEGLFFKPYACCRWIHGAIDGTLALIRQNRLSPDEIEEIIIHTFKRAVELRNNPKPATNSEAQFSAPFCVAAAAVRGPESLLPMDCALLKDQEVLALAERIRVEFDGDMEAKFPALAPARVRLAAGSSSFETEVEHPFGDPGNPMSRADIQTKFNALTRNALAIERRRKIIAELAGDSPSISSLSELIAARLEVQSKESK